MKPSIQDGDLVTRAAGREVQCGLGRVLPGPRDGGLLWHQDITKVLCEELGINILAF